MLKKITAAALCAIAFSQCAFASIYTPDEYAGAETIYDINFMDGNPLKTEKGIFEIVEEEPPIIVNHTFDDGITDKMIVGGGSFAAENGKYVQKSTDSIVSKAMIDDESQNFTIEFDATAISNASTMLLFLGWGNDGYFTFEYSYGGAVLRKNGTENIMTADCSFSEGQTSHFYAKVSGGALEVKVDGNDFLKTDEGLIPNGKCGIGTWASSIAFDNLIMKRLSSNGFDKKLVSGGEDEAIAFCGENMQNVRVTSNISVQSFIKSKAGLILRDNILFAADGKYAYICDISSDEKILASAPVRVKSGEFFLLEARAEGEKLTLCVNGAEIVSTYSSNISGGKCGIYKIGSPLTVNNIKIEIINDADLTEKMSNAEHTCAYNILKTLNIADLSSAPQKSVTRLDFAQYICRLLRIAPSGKANFSDTDSEYAAAISNSGYMSCISENIFGADIPIKTLDAAKVIADICGYKNLAVQYGGYPSGYESCVSSLKLTSGISNEYLTYADAALLLMRGLFLDRYSQNTLSGDIKSIAEETYSLREISGICESKNTGLTVGSNQAVINGIEIYCENPAEFEGRFVKAYYTDIKGEQSLIYAYKTKSDEYTIQSEDIERSDNLLSLTYSGAAGTKTERFAPNTKIIYNGEYLCTASENALPSYEIEQGSITVVKNKSGLDFVFIDESKTILAGRVSVTNESVFDILTDKTISLKDTDIFSSSGDEISFSDICEYDTIKLYPSKDKNQKAYVSKAISIQGKISDITEEKIRIGGDLFDYYKSIGNIKKIKVGSEAIFYFDKDYKALYGVNINSEAYAYLANAVYNEDENTVRLWIYSLTDGAIKCDAADKVTFCDSSVSAKSSRVNAKTLYNAIKDYSGIIRCKINENGCVSSISLPRIAGKREDPQNDGIFTKNFSKENCQQIFNTFYSRFSVTPSTLIVIVPQDRKNLDAYEMKQYGTLLDDELYTVDIYDCNEKYEIGAAAIFKEPVYYNKPSGVIKEITSSVDSDGNDCFGIVMYSQGSFKTVYAKEDMLCDNDAAYSFGTGDTHVSDLKCGDVISFHTNSDGYLKDFIPVFKNKENQEFYRTSINGWWSENVPHQTLAMGYAEVTRVYSDRFYIKMFYGTVNCISKSATSYCIYDKKSKQLLTGATVDDLQEGDKVVCVWNNSYLYTVAIYR